MSANQDQVEIDYQSMPREDLEKMCKTSNYLLGREAIKVKNLREACNDAADAMNHIDHSMARWAKNMLNKALQNNPL